MLIRVSGYNSGVKEYLEEGVKNGRDYSREELDERLILYGDLDLTDMVYKSIPDRGQNRYTTFTLAFKEDEISEEVLKNITKEFREFMMYAYNDVEYNFYAEAHIPKLKTVYDKRTGEKIERKPHIHIVVPKINLLSGNVSDVIGNHETTEKFIEAFQEYVNQKYCLASPREHVRVNPYNAADVLSRYKGDDFRGKNREFKQSLVRKIIDTDVRSREGFYSLVSSCGDTRIVNEGKDNEYIKVKLEGDAKYTTLKETIFNDAFITERKLSRPPLEKNIIAERLQEWPMRSKEIKYVVPDSKKNRANYYSADAANRIEILSAKQHAFYEKFGGQNELHPSQRERSHQRSVAEDRTGLYGRTSHSLQSMSGGTVAADGQSRIATAAVFLPGKARVHMASATGQGNSGLRYDLHGGRAGRTETASEGAETDGENGARREESSGKSGYGTAAERKGSPATGEGGPRGKYQEGADGTAKYSQGRAVAGVSTENGEGQYQGGEGRDEEREENESGNPATGDNRINPSSAYPGDSGSGRLYQYAGIPSLGRSDAAIRIRGGFGTGRLEPGLPVYARNGLRVQDLTAVDRNTQRLFSDSVEIPPPRPSRVMIIRRVMPKAPKNASYLAASLQRRQEQGTLTGDQRRAMYRADSTYFDTRRQILSDGRLTTKDKTQMLAILTFERLKAHQHITRPEWLNSQENNTMGSENIRKNIRPERTWRNSIKGSQKENNHQPKGARQRFATMSKEMEESLGERSIREKVRIITAADLYTRKASLSDNIHYLDKKTDKTLFIDTGKAIAVSKNGMSESGVAVALELAKEKFGSTLTVKGTEAFKNTAIEVVAQKGLDIHFTDKEMNRRLAERKQELALEREGQNISAGRQQIPATPEGFREAFAAMEKNYQAILASARTLPNEELEKHFAEIRETRKELTVAWLELPDSDPLDAPDSTCREFEAEIYGALESATRKQNGGPEENRQGAEAEPRQNGGRRVTHEGILLEHGSAPYNFVPDMSKPEDERDDSYYVKLQRPDGTEKIVWGVTLEGAVHSLNVGERVSLMNLGKEKVEWDQQLANGQSERRSGERVAWEGKPLDREVTKENDVPHEYQQYEPWQDSGSEGPSVA
ncbi:LPD7 domain-containing protein [Erwinia amylovora]|uniref:LPD7 domain-containing protein n=1 Tax=Erwinia amylovora TaxID=552 RepID=UPI001443BC8E|nr:LPD7 domain-containing protein [Erwinia amylovora]